MLTSSGTNAVDQLIPNHHFTLITHPMLGARSRSKPIQQRLSTENGKWDATNDLSRQSSMIKSPSSISSSNRMDLSLNSRKLNVPSHHESSDSGIDLSLSTNSSIQNQQYSQSNIIIHRPLSALDEDSNTDDGFINETQSSEKNQSAYLRFPPISLGRNRSMEDILSQSKRDKQEQHRSSSFSDDRQEKFSRRKEQQMKRSSDGMILDLQNNLLTSNKYSQNNSKFVSNDSSYRSINDLTKKTSRQVPNYHYESNISTEFSNLPTTHTTIRKPNSLTLKPLRKKSKLNGSNESTISLVSSRRHEHEEQMNSADEILNINNTQNNSNNLITPRARMHLVQPHKVKQKPSTIPSNYSHFYDEHDRKSFQTRTNLERHHHLPLTIQPRRGVLQQMLPFDASPSKVNNLLLRHQLQQPQTFYSNSTIHGNPSPAPSNSNFQHSLIRQTKAPLSILSTEDTKSNYVDESTSIKAIATKNERNQEQNRKKPSTLIEDSIPLNRAHRKSIGKDLPEISMEQIELTSGQRKSCVSSQVHQESEELNDFLQRKIFDKSPAETEILSQTSKMQHDQLNNTKNFRLNYVSKQKSNNERNETMKMINSATKTHENRTKTSFQATLQKHRFIDPYHESKTPVSFVRQQKQMIHNERLINRTNDNVSQKGSESLLNSQKNPKKNRFSRPSDISFQTSEISMTNQDRKPTQLLTAQQQQHQKKKINVEQSQESKSKQKLDPIEDTEFVCTKIGTKADSTLPNSKGYQEKVVRKDSIDHVQLCSPKSSTPSSDHRSQMKDGRISEKMNVHLSQSSGSSSSHEDFLDDNLTTPRTYRLIESNNYQHVFNNQSPSRKNSLTNEPLSQGSSRHTFPFSFVPNDRENLNELNEDSMNNNNKAIKPVVDIFTLSDREETWNSLDEQRSPLTTTNKNLNVQFSSNTMESHAEQHYDNEKQSICETDDGWSDDSAELIYVDEKYMTERRKIH